MRTFSCPTIVSGDDALTYLHRISKNKALVVTERDFVLSGSINEVTPLLNAAGIQWQVFDQVGKLPALEAINKGGRMASEYQPDWIISLGGQGCMAIAKAIVRRVAATQFDSEPEAADEIGHPGRRTGLMVIPAYGGSSDDVMPVPDALFDGWPVDGEPGMPSVAILAPEPFQRLSPQDIALVGLEALANAIEGYGSPWGSTITDGPALLAARQVIENLENACADAGDVEARTQLQYAVFLAGLPAGPITMGLAHGLARAVADTYQLPRRLATGLLLPYAMAYLIEQSIQTTARYDEIARLCGISRETAMDGALALVARLRSCAAKIGQPTCIRECIPDRAQFDAGFSHLVASALGQASVLRAVRVPDKACMEALFHRAYEGGQG